jgi:hypothetical protein
MAELLKEAVRALSRVKDSLLIGSARGSLGGPEDHDPRVPDGPDCRDRSALTAEQLKAARARGATTPKAS